MPSEDSLVIGLQQDIGFSNRRMASDDLEHVICLRNCELGESRSPMSHKSMSRITNQEGKPTQNTTCRNCWKKYQRNIDPSYHFN